MKKILSILLAVAMLLSLAACGQSAASPKADTRIIVDHGGNEVEVPLEVNRVAVCSILPLPSVLAVFFDSAEKIVGMASGSKTAAENSLLGQLYPELLKAETGYIEGGNLNVEELMKLAPDVVFYSTAEADVGEQLRNAGFCAVAVSVNKWEYDAIETLNNWIDLLEEIFPENDKQKIVAEFSQAMYDLVQSRVAEVPEKERVLFLYKYSDTAIMTSGAKFFGQWWAEAIGTQNVGQDMTTDNSVTVNMEQIYDWNPSLIFITNFTTAYPNDLYQNTVGNYDWSPVDAVKNEQVYKMPLGMYRSYTPGVDTPITLLWLAKTAYPEQFADIDIIVETQKYYKEVFDIDLTADQAASIFAPAAEVGAGF